MTHVRCNWFASAGMLAALAAAVPAAAQTTAADPPHTLEFSFALMEAYDADGPLEAAPTVDTTVFDVGDYSTMLTAGGEYAWSTPNVQLGATGTTALRYFPHIDDIRSVSHTGAIGFSVRLPKRMTLFVNQTAVYSPSLLYGLFPADAITSPGAAPAAPPDYAAGNSEAYSYGTMATLTHDLTRRSSISAGADYLYNDIVHESQGRGDMVTYGVLGRFSRGISRNATMNVSYHLRQGDFGSAPVGVAVNGRQVTTEHGLDIGMDYSRRLSATRRATLGLSFGPSQEMRPISVGPEASNVRLHGEVRAGYQFSQTWQLSATYRRDRQYVAGFTAPVNSDGFMGSLGGALTRRLTLALSAAYSSGESTLDRNDLLFDTYTGDATLQFRLTRSLSAYAQYLYYVYDFRGDTLLAPLAAPHLERTGIRAGVMWRVTALGRR